jgi:hypothetical protein
MQGFQPADYLGIKMAASKKDDLRKGLLSKKRGGRLAKFLQWLAKGSEDSPPCYG